MTQCDFLWSVNAGIGHAPTRNQSINYMTETYILDAKQIKYGTLYVAPLILTA